MMDGAKYGAIAGAIATWAISSILALAESGTGLPIGSFYYIIGIALGMNDVITASYFGFGLHMFVGTLMGAIVGSVFVRLFPLSPVRGVLLGMAAGIVIWLMVFLPISAFLVAPSITRVVTLLALNTNFSLSTSEVNQFVQTIGLSSVVFHLVWGTMVGFIITSLFRIKSYREKNWKAMLEDYLIGKGDEKRSRVKFSILGIGMLAGLLSSVAVSGLILVAEKTISIPVGTFYLVLASSLTQSLADSFNMIVAGLLLHFLAGSIIGLMISIPFAFKDIKISTVMHKYAPVYGLTSGLIVWAFLFVPITFWVIIPQLTNLSQDLPIVQQTPVGTASSITVDELLSLSDKILVGALVFNMFYGLVTSIIIESYAKKMEERRNTERIVM